MRHPDAERSEAEGSDSGEGEIITKMKLHKGPYAIYIMANKTRTIYTGMSNSLRRRVNEHKEKLIPGFTKRYNIDKLVYFEFFDDVRDAIAREKQIKGFRRSKKVALIESMNREWKDLSDEI